MADKNRGQKVPKKITHYSVGAAIGGGGMGVVYRGKDRRDDSPVAIKLLHPHLAEDESFRERFEREAHVGALLRSPYVVRLLDYGVAEGRYFIVMEFIEGQNLKEAITAAPLSAARVLRIGAQTARALEEAEVRGIVHRDIKPDNILLGPGDTVKVADFGIAKQLSSGTLTMPGAFIGTLFYAAPELALGRADNRSDVYSLGATLFHAMTGHPPFRGDAIEVLRHHAETEVPEDELQSIPVELREIIAKCLKKDPGDRYQSCTQLAGELEKAASRLGQAATDAPTVVSPEPAPKAEDLTAATQVVPPAGGPEGTSASEAAPPVEAAPVRKEQEPATGEARPKTAEQPPGRGRTRPVPPSRRRGLPSWIPAAAGGLLVAAAAVVALVFLGNLGGDDDGGGNEPAVTIGRDGMRRMLPAQVELGAAYSAFQLNPDVSGYVSRGAILGLSCPAPSTTPTTATTPLPPPVESYDNQYEFELSLATERGTFALIFGVDNFPDEDAAEAALNDFIADPARHISLGTCPDNEIQQSDDFDPAGIGGDATGVEQLVHQTDGETEREFTVTAVGFTRETILGRVLIAHFDSPEHQASAAEIAVNMDARIEQILGEITATQQATPTPSTSGSPSPSGSPGRSPSGSPTTTGGATTPAPTVAPGQPLVVQSLGCSPASVITGQTVSCSPSISGAASSRSWSASGGSPGSGSGSTFSTSYGSSGSKTISLQVCNNNGCDSASQVIFVSAGATPVPTAPPTQAPSVPVVNSLGCSPTTVQTGQTVTCNPSVTGTVTDYGWSVSGGSPSSGAGSTFSTTFDSAGAKFIDFAACNAGLCGDGAVTIEVTGSSVGNFTVFMEDAFLFSLEDTVEVTLFIETPSVGLGDYDIDIIYDPTVITPIACTDWLGGGCDPFFFSNTVNTFGSAFQSGTFAIATVTFAVVGCCFSDLIVDVFDMTAADGSDVVGNLIEISGSVTTVIEIEF